ncbi:MAG: GGDEF domain-containing protein [Planctomycetaceae bacterium]|nr:GGDEF domain-containing protein [Planctomycetaceae bacterium]
MTITLGCLEIPLAWALAVGTAFAYMFYVLGQCSRRMASTPQFLKLQQELRRAHLAASQLEKIVNSTQANLKKHQSLLKGFRHKVIQIKGSEQGEEVWERLGREIEEILSPTIQLASQIATAHDVIRYESSMLMAFTDVQTDSLTGVCNRRGLDQVLATQFAKLHRHGPVFSLVIFDIDRFKDVNDCGGHAHGDSLLRELAALLKQECREVDVVARYGGDEFVIVMPHTDLDDAASFAERVRQKIETSLTLTISVGVASTMADDTPATLLARGDKALYRSKAAGRNCVSCADDSVPASHDSDSDAGHPLSVALYLASPNTSVPLPIAP